MHWLQLALLFGHLLLSITRFLRHTHTPPHSWLQFALGTVGAHAIYKSAALYCCNISKRNHLFLFSNLFEMGRKVHSVSQRDARLITGRQPAGQEQLTTVNPFIRLFILLIGNIGLRGTPLWYDSFSGELWIGDSGFDLGTSGHPGGVGQTVAFCKRTGRLAASKRVKQFSKHREKSLSQ